jgi:staphylococcal nuclease domain-containing protein 1
MFKRENDKEIPEAFSEQARFFTECRLLQRDVKVSLDGVYNQLVYGTIKHPVSGGVTI